MPDFVFATPEYPCEELLLPAVLSRLVFGKRYYTIMKCNNSSREGDETYSGLKVLHVASWYPCSDNPVIGTFIREHVRATALFNRVIVIHGRAKSTTEHGFLNIYDREEEGIRTIRFKYATVSIPPVDLACYFLAVLAVFRRLVCEGFRPDVIHAHVFVSGFTAALIGQLYGIPVVITEHFNGFQRGSLSFLDCRIAKFAFQKADMTCPVSDDLRRHIESYGIRMKSTVVPNTFDPMLYNYPGRGGIMHRPRKRLLFVGLLNYKKGVPYLLQAIRLLKDRRDDFILDIIGDGPARKEYDEMVRELGLEHLVRFHGLKRKEEIAVFMRESYLLVLPSIWENLPCVVIEAMASGLPVVSTQVGGLPELVDREVGFLVEPKNPEALAEAIEYVLEKPDSFDKEKISAKAIREFSLEAVGKRYSDLYKMMVEKSARRM